MCITHITHRISPTKSPIPTRKNDFLREAVEIERRLADADVKQDILDKIEKLNKDLVDMAIEYLATETVVKEFLKKLSYYQIEYNKRLAEIRLNDLQILKC